jgi:hypothetical protein
MIWDGLCKHDSKSVESEVTHPTTSALKSENLNAVEFGRKQWEEYKNSPVASGGAPMFDFRASL